MVGGRRGPFRITLRTPSVASIMVHYPFDCFRVEQPHGYYPDLRIYGIGHSIVGVQTAFAMACSGFLNSSI